MARTIFFYTSQIANSGISLYTASIETHTAFGADGMARSIHVVETQDKVELTDSVRYREGLGEREVFHAFRDWAMKSDSATLHIRVSRPILPGDAAGDARER